MTVFDRYLAKMPGSIQFKAFGAGMVLCAALGYPVFAGGTGKQGHDYFSQERPEAVLQGEERSRKQYLKEREERREERRKAAEQQS